MRCGLPKLRPLHRAVTQTLAWAGLAVPCSALAIGLGLPLGNPTVGQPLRLEIPVTLFAGERPLTPECVRMTLPPDTPDRQFFPRNARVSLDASRPGAPRIVIVSPLAVTEPLIEFRLIVGCQNELGKDFLVLTNLPDAPGSAVSERPQASTGSYSTAKTSATRAGIATAEPLSAAPVIAATGQSEPTSAPRPTSAAPQPARPPASGATQTLQLTRDTNLNTLARARYPANQATRDEYRRLMAQANPELFAGKTQVGSIPLPAGTLLLIPPNLPQPEAENQKAPEPQSAPPAPPKPTKPVKPSESAIDALPPAGARKDRLVIGGDSLRAARPLSPKELAAAIERMERMVEDQGRTEVELSENIKTLSAAFIEIKDYLVALEAKTRQLESEQKQAKLREETRPEPKNLGIFELLALILAGGGVGAALLGFQHRLQIKRLALTPGALDEHSEEEADRTATAVAAIAPIAPIAPLSTVKVPAATEQEDLSPLAAPRAAHTAKPVSAAAPAAVSPAPTFVAPTTNPTRLSAPALAQPGLTAPQHNTPAPLSPIARPAADRVPASPSLEFLPDLPVAPPSSPEPQPARMLELELPLEYLSPEPAATALPPVAVSPLAESDRDAALELAVIMESMGLAKEAARTLVEHIYQDPKRDLAPWLQALGIYRKTGQREEFDTLAASLREHLNVQPRSWDEFNQAVGAQSLAEYHHLSQRLQSLWPTPDCEDFLVDLMSDNRQGTRAGFPQEVAEEILLLAKVLHLREKP